MSIKEIALNMTTDFVQELFSSDESILLAFIIGSLQYENKLDFNDIDILIIFDPEISQRNKITKKAKEILSKSKYKTLIGFGKPIDINYLDKYNFIYSPDFQLLLYLGVTLVNHRGNIEYEKYKYMEKLIQEKKDEFVLKEIYTKKRSGKNQVILANSKAFELLENEV